MKSPPPPEFTSQRQRKWLESLTTENPHGRATLVAGVAVVSDNRIRDETDVMLTCQIPGGTPGFLRISARVSEESFTITSSNVADTSVVAWELLGVPT